MPTCLLSHSLSALLLPRGSEPLRSSAGAGADALSSAALPSAGLGAPPLRRAEIAETKSALRIAEVPVMPSWPASFLRSGSFIPLRGPEAFSAVVVSVTVLPMSFPDYI